MCSGPFSRLITFWLKLIYLYHFANSMSRSHVSAICCKALSRVLGSDSFLWTATEFLSKGWTPCGAKPGPCFIVASPAKTAMDGSRLEPRLKLHGPARTNTGPAAPDGGGYQGRVVHREAGSRRLPVLQSPKTLGPNTWPDPTVLPDFRQVLQA